MLHAAVKLFFLSFGIQFLNICSKYIKYVFTFFQLICFNYLAPFNITSPPMSVNVTAPSAASFTCVATGYPTANITWTMSNGVVIQSDDQYSIQSVHGHRRVVSTLRINITSISMNGTQYGCNTVGIVGNAPVTVNAFAYLMIFGKKLFTLYHKPLLHYTRPVIYVK